MQLVNKADQELKPLLAMLEYSARQYKNIIEARLAVRYHTCMLKIDTLCVDLADSENAVVYIECWGPYDSKYGLYEQKQ